MSAGDVLFTFPAVGYMWTAYDARDAAEAGDLYREIAVIYPTDAGGDRLEEITVKGATRRNVRLRARWAGQRVQVTEPGLYGEGLTARTRLEVCTVAEHYFTEVHPVAELSQDELAERATASLAGAAKNVAYEAYRDSAYWNSQTLGAVTIDQRRAAVKAATEAFAAELADRMRVAL